MKCRQCGASIKLETNFCPYCGAENHEYKLHRRQMFRLKKDYEETKEQVLEENQRIAAFSVKITVIAVLVTLNLILWFLIANSWDIMYDYRRADANKNSKVHREKLMEYEKENNYFMFSTYYDENMLHSVDDLEEFRQVYQACSNYQYAYSMIINLHTPNNYLSKEESIKTICDHLEYMYDSIKPGEYDDPISYQGQHKEIMDSLKEDVAFLLITYTGITKEEASRFHEMSDGQRQVALERGLRIYED